jgi:NAD(P)-dependent dehydrogenase (short-subunit alcohol dehydrogenase family)
MADAKTWLITGVSTGLGRSLAEAALARGDVVVGTLRRPDQLGEFEALAPGRAFALLLDVTDREAVRTAIPAALDARGGVDVVVNNAGYALTGAVEEVSDDEVAHQLGTNLLGAAWVIAAALPALRKRGGGRVINISSQAGIIGYAGLSIYSASKFALEGLSEALRQELAPFGVAVTIVEPGAFRTDWAGRSMVYTSQGRPEYAQQSEQTRKLNERLHGNQRGDPAKAATALLTLADADAPPLRLVLGSDALRAITKKLTATLTEIDAWSELTRSTDSEQPES